MSNLIAAENDVEQSLSCDKRNKSRSPSAMFLYLRELFFLFALVFTSYTALFNSIPKIGKPPTPVPFFPKNSLVVDHYKGNVNIAFQRASEVDLTIVMYYAPWDAESQAARFEFEAAAQFFYNEAYFTAISCWSPNTECKQHVPRIRHFPVIVAYPQHSKGIHYQGPIKSVYLINFIKALMRPIQRIFTPLDIIEVSKKHNGALHPMRMLKEMQKNIFSLQGEEYSSGKNMAQVCLKSREMMWINKIMSLMNHKKSFIVGLRAFHLIIVLLVGSFIFNGNLGGAGYYTFYSAATKMLEKDPFHEIAFAVTTDNDAAVSIEFETVPSVRLYLWNETFDYPSDADYSDESLVKWVWHQMHQVVQWVSPPKLKSRTLSPHISQGPVLILFTPRNPLFGINPMYNMLREMALRYYECSNILWVKHVYDYIEIENRGLKSSRSKLEKYCLKKRREKEFLKSSIFMPSVIVPKPLLNSSECIKPEDNCDQCSSHSKYLGPQSEICFKRSKANNAYLNSYRPKNSYDGTLFFDVEDDRSSNKLLHFWKEEQCKSLEHGDEYFKLPYPKYRNTNFNDTIKGLACANNRTLSMIAMDSLSYYQFAEGLGINILELKSRTAAVIIDKNAESQYILKEVNTDSLTSFIMNHTKNTLNRFLRSSHDQSARSITRHRYPVRSPENCTHTEVESCVPELSSKNFLDYVLDQSKAVLVFYHTPYCALCRSISHLFLLLSRYFRHFPMIKFARIDGDNNDLPWEYAMDLFPALLFFPTFKKSESRLYSNDLPYTIRNLIHFVLGNLEPEAKIPAMISLCLSFEKLQNENEARKCKSKIQKESYENLSRTLKDVRRTISRWKNMPSSSQFMPEIRQRRKVLLFKLEYFKNIHLLLGSIDKLQLNSTVVTDIIKLYQKFLLLIRSNSYYLNYDGFR